MTSLYMLQFKRLKNCLLRWMDHYFKHMILMLLTICVASSIQAAELNFKNVLEQERAWAGLTSKKSKIMKSNGHTVKGEIHKNRRCCCCMVCQARVIIGTALPII